MVLRVRGRERRGRDLGEEDRGLALGWGRVRRWEDFFSFNITFVDSPFSLQRKTQMQRTRLPDLKARTRLRVSSRV